MDIEIISIGDELLIGQTVNTNASWLGERLLYLGLQVRWISTVSDSKDDLWQALEHAENRAQIVLLTGGLGPTHDDVTKAVVSRYFHSRLIVNDNILAEIQKRFERRGIAMAEINKEQAQVPDNAQLIENPHGTAPGFIFEKNKVRFYVMPGVPKEMKAMMENRVLNDIRNSVGIPKAKTRILCTTGIAESSLFEKISDLEKIEAFAHLAFLPSFTGVRIRLTAFASESRTAEENLDRAEKMIRNRAGDFVYANRDVPLEVVVAELLIEKNLSVSVAESCTGGLLAHKLTNISGSSAYFKQGLVVYSNEAKISYLDIPQDMLKKYGAVSEKVAAQLALSIRDRAGTDYGLGITGIAGPTGGTPTKPVGLVYIGFADKKGARVEKQQFAGDRIENKERAVQAALDMLRKTLLMQK